MRVCLQVETTCAFQNNDQTPTSTDEVNRPAYLQAKPVLRSDVMFEIEGATQEWSSFVDRKNGEVVGLPSQTIEFVGEGEDSDNDCGEDFLELARRICGSDDFVSLPSQFDVHEWSIMRDFCKLVDSDSDRTALLAAVHSSGALRRFKATITRRGLEDQWFNFKKSCDGKMVIDWLQSQSIQWSRTKSVETPFLKVVLGSRKPDACQSAIRRLRLLCLWRGTGSTFADARLTAN